jgi:hypothetical protein
MFAAQLAEPEMAPSRIPNLVWLEPVESSPEAVEAHISHLLEDGLLGPLRASTKAAAKPDTVLWKPRAFGSSAQGGRPFGMLSRLPLEVATGVLGLCATLLGFSLALWRKSRRLAEVTVANGEVTLVFARRPGAH